MTSCSTQRRPVIIQGGMGVGVSSWQLAHAVARTGQLGVVSGTALDAVVARRLQDGDPGGHVRRPSRLPAAPTWPSGCWTATTGPRGRRGAPYRPTPAARAARRPAPAHELAVVGNFVEVWLAKEGHGGLVGINFLEKIQMATPGGRLRRDARRRRLRPDGGRHPARDPAPARRARRAPARHGARRRHRAATPRLVTLDPTTLAPRRRPAAAAPPDVPRDRLLARPGRSTSTARTRTRPDGFVVEGPRAGGHNAPPRGKLAARRDRPAGLRPAGRRRPRGARRRSACRSGWPAATASPSGCETALEAGAAGVQVGTLFALCRESGLRRPAARGSSCTGCATARSRCAPTPRRPRPASRSRSPQLPGTLVRRRRCTRPGRGCATSATCASRTPAPDGQVGYRCPAEPVDVFIRKGGDRRGRRRARSACATR